MLQIKYLIISAQLPIFGEILSQKDRSDSATRKRVNE